MIITTGRSRRDKRWRQQEMTWEELSARLGSFLRTKETAREYKSMSKDEQSALKDVGGFVGGRLKDGVRNKASVLDRGLVTLDADYADAGLPEAINALWGMTMAVYSTHSSTKDAPRYRFIIPLTRAVTPAEYIPVARKLAERIGLQYMDPTTYEPERLMYWPSCSIDAEPEFWSFTGDTVSPDDVLAEYGPSGEWMDTRLWPIAEQEKEITLREYTKAGEPTAKPGMVGLFCRTYDVPTAIEELLPGVYESAGDGRYTYTAGSTAAGAVVYNDGAFLYSNHATDPAGGQCCNAFDLVRLHKFGALDAGTEETDVTRRKSYVEMCKYAGDLPAVKRQLAEERMAEADAAFADLADPRAGTGNTAANAANDTTEDTTEAAEDDMSWVEQLSVNRKTGEADSTIQNAHIILTNDPNLRGAIAVNELKGRPVIRRPLPWHPVVQDKRNGDGWTDSDNAELRLYMETVWKFIGKDRIQDAFDSVVSRCSFHPVREYLSGLFWDGTPRMDTLLIRYFGAEDNRYVRAVTRKWLTAAVKRAFEPGCKFDSVLVLCGRQGVGKSRFFKALSRDWFSDSLGRMDASKDALERLSGVWIAEIAELAAAKRSEVEDIKNFISKQTDTFRRAFQRETGEYPRQCVFAATTNSPEMLRDRSGNRRFWIVDVAGLDDGVLTGLDDEVDQIWAEAVEAYRAGERLWLDDSGVRAMAEEQQELHSVQDDLAGIIQAYLDAPIPTDWEELDLMQRRDWVQGSSLIKRDPEQLTQRDKVCTWEIRCELFNEPLGGGDRNRALAVADIMSHMPGWKKGKQRRTKLYGTQWMYFREDSAFQKRVRELTER